MIEHERVERTIGRGARLLGSRDQLERHGGHHTQSAGRPVELSNLAVGEKPAPRLLEFADERNGTVGEVAVRCDDTTVGAHRTEGDGKPPCGAGPALGHDGDVVGGGGAVVGGGGGGGGGGGAAVVGGAVGGGVGAGAGGSRSGCGSRRRGRHRSQVTEPQVRERRAPEPLGRARRARGAGAAPPRGVGAGADGARGAAATVGAPGPAGGAGTVVVAVAGSTTGVGRCRGGRRRGGRGEVDRGVDGAVGDRSWILPGAGSSSGGWGSSSWGPR